MAQHDSTDSMWSRRGQTSRACFHFFRNIYSTSPGCFTVCRDLYEFICVNLLQCILDALFQSFLFLFKKNIYFYFYFFCYFFNLIKQLFGVRIQQFTNDSKT